MSKNVPLCLNPRIQYLSTGYRKIAPPLTLPVYRGSYYTYKIIKPDHYGLL